MKNKCIFIPMILLILVSTCQRDTEKRKIKLSDHTTTSETNSQLSSTIYLEPALRRAVAVMFFENKTGDQDLEWLQQGLTEMFNRALSQSQNLSVLGTERLHEIVERLTEKGIYNDVDLDMAAIVAKETNVEAVLSGSIIKSGDSLQINVRIHETNQGQILKEESIEGIGLENLFTMVDELTRRIKNELRVSLEKEQEQSIADLSTKSLEAWKYFTNGMDFLNQFLLVDARRNFEKAIEFDSTFVAANLQLCPILYNHGATEKGREVLNKLLTLREKATPQEEYQIDLLDAGINGNIQKQMDLSAKWLDQYPDDRDANFNLATIHYNRQKYSEAIHYYNKVLEIDPNYNNATNILGYSYANIGDYENAISAMKRYKEQAPDEPNPYDSMGEIYSYKGDFKNAEKEFRKAININDDFLFARIGLGNVLLEKGQYKKALKTFNETLEKATVPTDKANVHTNIGITHWRLGNTNKAVEHLKQSIHHRDDQYRIMTWLNEIYKDRDDITGRIESLKTNYDLLKESINTIPTRIYSLSNMSLWYDVNAIETTNVIDNILETTENPVAKMWARFFRALLYLRTNQLDKFKETSKNFTDDLMEILKAAQDVRLSYSVWRNFTIFNQYAYNFKDEGLEKYNRLISFCQKNNMKITESAFRSFLADLYFHTSDVNKAREQLKSIGIPEENKWYLIGPFDHKNGFNKKYPPEKEIRLNRYYKGKNQKINWQQANDNYMEGYIDLKENLKQYNWSVGYGLIYVESPDERQVQIRVGTNDATKIWLNEKLVWTFNIGRDAIFDDDIINVTLQQGLNKILIKVCNRISLWGYYFRITDEEGNGVPDIEFINATRLKK
jgi:tetratricopeptide (TPR) repeat protein